MSTHITSLAGCTPEPLMDYLKAVGILRLVAEQKDPGARARWHNGVFELRSALDERTIVQFLIEEYQPTPIVVPWSGSDFFNVNRSGDKGPFKKTPTAKKILEAFLATASRRLAMYRETISLALATLNACGIDNKTGMEDRKAKSEFISKFRSSALEEIVQWIDACSVISNEKASFSSLLGSGGGSDGNTHFSDNFMQNLWEVLPEFDEQRTFNKVSGGNILQSALFGELSCGLVRERTSSLYDAGAVGGPNAGQGFERASIGNPWGIILCLEGTMLLAGCVARHHVASGSTRASFPFQVRLTPTRTDTASEQESAGREIWMPMWSCWVSKAELAMLFSEGRASLDTKQVDRGVDFARAAASLGVDRGITSFQRYAIVRGRVGGENYNTSASLGRFEVRARPDVDLLFEIDPWIESFRRAASDDKAPPCFRSALRRIQSAIFEFCQHGGHSRFGAILCAFGQAERELARSEKFRGDKIRPIAGLSPDWIRAVFDASVEFELALALSGIRDREGKIGPLRANLEPVRSGADKRGKVYWTDQDRAAVWTSADLPTNLAAVLERRIMDGGRRGCVSLPLAFRRSASLNAIADFLSGQTDDAGIEELLWGLVLVDQGKDYPELDHWRSVDVLPLPRAFALLKLLFLPFPLETRSGPTTIRPEPSLLPLLRAGRMDEACALAMRRLRASGLVPMTTPPGARAASNEEWQAGGIDPRRLAAALLFPISMSDVKQLADLVLRPVAEPVKAVV